MTSRVTPGLNNKNGTTAQPHGKKTVTQQQTRKVIEINLINQSCSQAMRPCISFGGDGFKKENTDSQLMLPPPLYNASLYLLQ